MENEFSHFLPGGKRLELDKNPSLFCSTATCRAAGTSAAAVQQDQDLTTIFFFFLHKVLKQAVSRCFMLSVKSRGGGKKCKVGVMTGLWQGKKGATVLIKSFKELSAESRTVLLVEK